MHSEDVFPTITVQSPARLHFGLFNESGSDGWVDGGAGVALASPHWSITIRGSTSDFVSIAPGIAVNIAALSQKILHDVLARFNAHRDVSNVSMEIHEGIKFHVGLGANTSLRMAIGNALLAITGQSADIRTLGTLVGRGGTSGVGVNLAGFGGLVIDSGHRFPIEKSMFGPSSSILASAPALLDHGSLPDDWRAILIYPGGSGLHGADEAAFFSQHCPVQVKDTYRIIEVRDSLLVESIKTINLGMLQDFLHEIQSLGLKKSEWGIQSIFMRSFREAWSEARLKDKKLAPLALSSMGPTCFLITDDPQRQIRTLQRLGIGASMIRITQIQNSGVVTNLKRVA